MRWSETLRVGALAAMVFVGAGVPVVAQNDAEVTASGGYRADSQECKFLRIINKYRGNDNLKLSASLGKAAEANSEDQARRDKMDHSDDLRQAVSREGYPNSAGVGENVAWGTNLDSAKGVFNAWKKSPSHDRNMKEKDFRAIGIAREKGNKGWYWTTIFGEATDQTVNC